MGPSKAEGGSVRTQMTAEKRQTQEEIPDPIKALQSYQPVMKSPAVMKFPYSTILLQVTTTGLTGGVLIS